MEAFRQAVDGGFSDAVLEGQAVFRAMLDAMARPGSIHAVKGLERAPAPLTPVAAAIAATVLDADTPVWLGPVLSASPAVVAWIAFHTGAPVVANAGEAAFVLCCDPANIPALETFAQGSQEYPDRSATLILQVTSLDGGEALLLEGPGIPGQTLFSPTPLPRHFREQWQANGRRFPRGIDLVFAGPHSIAAMPRTVTIAGGEG
jgi:alpha-D-ribose 1-methylphosphonate 5-triphosphate synthase subunit PhnH